MTLNEQAPRPSELPHPVVFDVEYPERHSRWLILVKWLLIIPQAIIAYLLGYLVLLLAVFAWFAILFTGRYPRSMFDFAVGCQRWSANVFAYFALLRDEYPPFSFDRGEYPLTLEIPHAERQSRFRLFIRAFAIVPNWIVLQFVILAWFLTSFISWWAILIAGRYPRGLFKFSVGVQRWYHRAAAYLYVLRDEYPPYSVKADARPGQEVVSAIIGAPIFAGYVAVYVTFALGTIVGGGETTTVDRALLESPERFAAARPTTEVGSLRITIVDVETRLRCPDAAADSFATCFSVTVDVEKDGFLPAFYTPYFFSVGYCIDPPGDEPNRYSPVEVEGTEFRYFFRDSRTTSTVYFELGAVAMCELDYLGGIGGFEFE